MSWNLLIFIYMAQLTPKYCKSLYSLPLVVPVAMETGAPQFPARRACKFS